MGKRGISPYNGPFKKIEEKNVRGRKDVREGVTTLEVGSSILFFKNIKSVSF